MNQATASHSASRSEFGATEGGREVNWQLCEDMKGTPVVSIRAMILRLLLRLGEPFYGPNEDKWKETDEEAIERTRLQFNMLSTEACKIANGEVGSYGSKIRECLEEM
jgi:hypothetical protein